MTKGEKLQNGAVWLARSMRRARERVPQWAVTGLQVAKSLGEALPDKNDGAVRRVMKTLNALHQVGDVLSPKMKEPMEELAQKLGLVKGESAYIAALIFRTPLREKFDVTTSVFGDDERLTRARHPDAGDFYFVHDKSYTASELGTWDLTYWSSGEASLERLVTLLWEIHEGRMRAGMTIDRRSPERGMSLNPMQRVDRAMGKVAIARMESLIERHRKHAARGNARCYLFHGAPGTGKSTCALAIGDRLGSRLLKLDPAALVHLGLDKMLDVLSYMRPDFLLVDDVDKVLGMKRYDGNSLVVLDVVEGMKEACPNVTMIFTCNNVGAFDAGLRRPGRIDTWVEFPLPDYAERAEVLRGYLLAQAVDVEEALFDELVKETAGLSQDYLRELASVCLHAWDPSESLQAAKTMRQLLKSES